MGDDEFRARLRRLAQQVPFLTEKPSTPERFAFRPRASKNPNDRAFSILRQNPRINCTSVLNMGNALLAKHRLPPTAVCKGVTDRFEITFASLDGRSDDEIKSLFEDICQSRPG